MSQGPHTTPPGSLFPALDDDPLVCPKCGSEEWLIVVAYDETCECGSCGYRFHLNDSETLSSFEEAQADAR